MGADCQPISPVVDAQNNILVPLTVPEVMKLGPDGKAIWRVRLGTAAAVIPPVLNLLAQAFGFAGAPNIGTVTHTPLPAPQATLISALAQRVVGGDREWTMLLVGLGLGVGLCVVAAATRAARKMKVGAEQVTRFPGGRHCRRQRLLQIGPMILWVARQPTPSRL